MRRYRLFVMVLAAAMTAASCGGSTATPSPSAAASAAATTPASSAAASGSPAASTASVAPSQGANTGLIGGKLVIVNVSGGTWSCQFNPFNGAVNYLSIGFVYEPLVFVNALQTNTDGSNKTTPWLASSTSWNADFTQLTATIRSGAKWSDGQPVTADDVVYTFNALKADAAIDLNALWKDHSGPLTSVAASGSDQVVFTFDAAAQTYFFYVAGQTPIVPRHVWSSQDQGKLDAYADSSPVGTGPYTMSECSANNIKFLRNPDYWQSTPARPVPQIAEVDYPAFLSNDPGNLVLAQGQGQWGGQYVPNIDSFYVSKDPVNRHYWFPPTSNVAIYPNLENPLLGKVAVRQAISLAINRDEVSKRGESGYEPASNQTGIVLPTYQSWYDKSIDTTAFDVAKAGQTLEAAGFTRGSDGIYADAGGQRLSFTMKTVSGYTDWDSSLAVVKQQLKAAGIEIKIIDEDSGQLLDELKNGKFELGYWGQTAGPLPYYEMRNNLFSGNIGTSNFERYKSADIDAALAKYAGADAAGQQAIVKQLATVMANDVPLIPVVESVDWYQYDTTDIGGWATPDDPFCQPAPWNTPDNGVMLTHLYPLH